MCCFSAKNDDARNETAKNKIECPQSEETQRKMSATILLVSWYLLVMMYSTLMFVQALGTLGCCINLLLVLLILVSRTWRQHETCGLGLVVHQCLVDSARSAILFPLGWSLMHCQAVSPECSVLETAFLCLATVSTVRSS